VSAIAATMMNGCSHADENSPSDVPIHELQFAITVTSRSRAAIILSARPTADPTLRLPVHRFNVRRVMSLDAVDSGGNIVARGAAQDDLGGDPAAAFETISFVFDPPLPSYAQPYTLVGTWLADPDVRVSVPVFVWPVPVVALDRKLSGFTRTLDNVIFTCRNALGRTNNAEMKRGAIVRIRGVSRLANHVRFVPNDLHDRVGFISFEDEPGLFVADPIIVSLSFHPRDARALRPVVSERPWIFREPCVSGTIIFQSEAQLHAYLH
jgi:hypothetical protein